MHAPRHAQAKNDPPNQDDHRARPEARPPRPRELGLRRLQSLLLFLVLRHALVQGFDVCCCRGRTGAASKAKTKAKRGRAASDEEDEDEEPDAKKAKTGQNGASDDKSGGASQKADPPAKMVTVVKRGAAPVDPCSGWGGMSSSAAVSAFKAQFKAKAAVNWEQRHGMVAKKGKYQWIGQDSPGCMKGKRILTFNVLSERVFEDEKPEDNAGPSGSGSSKKDVEPEKIPDSTLPQEIQALCRLMFSAKLIDATLSSMNYDANKLPLGKLAKSTILNGFAALKTLSEVISQPDGDTSRQHGGYRSAVEELTGRYYSIIPHVFGRNRPTTIDSLPLLKKELELVDALGDMEVASKLITSTVPKDANGKPLNPLDQNFLSLRLSSMDPIARDSKEFGALETYTRETHGATHRHYQVQVLNAFRVERQDETDAWMRAGNDKLADGERLLLWHGSRILSQGLRIAPPEAPVTGYMFGKGVYFADMMSKSANYCHAYLSDNTGILLLCEVAAKPFYEQHAANYNADQDCKAARARCTKGLGRTQPAEWQDAGAALENDALSGCHMPKGPGQDVQGIQGYLQYNEYIVYDTSQIRVRYLLMVKMN
ncbi:hypothetical protein EVJ58_g10471 [Rhodofomes roseus]|uniref:Poly [ADP-ribose] polymerase n=1 Tax=Rhodofomes roseus TaxID=34475 RepID=A0A4Y9XNE1_9APHY|nr:hypothetical protein EVJ58_g10471 [Rhodofomes roseus]